MPAASGWSRSASAARRGRRDGRVAVQHAHARRSSACTCAGGLSGWAAAKDVILKVAGILTVKGGTGAIVEYFGPGAESISATGKATICNMGAEISATCSLFPYDARFGGIPEVDRSRSARRPGRRARRAPGASTPRSMEDPERFFDRVIDIDLDELEPHLVSRTQMSMWRRLRLRIAKSACFGLYTNVRGT